MTVTLTTAKSKGLVILASSNETKNLLTADAYSFLLTSPLHNRMIDSESPRSSLFRMMVTLISSKSKELVILASSSETKNLLTADAYSSSLTLTTAQPDDRF